MKRLAPPPSLEVARAASGIRSPAALLGMVTPGRLRKLQHRQHQFAALQLIARNIRRKRPPASPGARV